MSNWRIHRKCLFAVLSCSCSYPVSDFGDTIIKWNLMSNPLIWLDRFWLFTVSIIHSIKLWSVNPTNIAIQYIECIHVHHLQNEEWSPLLIARSRCWQHGRHAATSNWIAFLCVYCTWSLHHSKGYVYSTISKIWTILGPFLVSIVNTRL